MKRIAVVTAPVLIVLAVAVLIVRSSRRQPANQYSTSSLISAGFEPKTVPFGSRVSPDSHLEANEGVVEPTDAPVEIQTQDDYDEAATEESPMVDTQQDPDPVASPATANAQTRSVKIRSGETSLQETILMIVGVPLFFGALAGGARLVIDHYGL